MVSNKLSPEYYKSLSYALLNDGKNALALEAARRAIYLGDISAESYEFAGIALTRLENHDDYDEAEFCLLKALAIDPTKTKLHFQLGYLSYFRGDYSGAEGYFIDFNQRYGGSYSTFLTLGRVYAARKEHQKAIDMFDKCLASVPDWPPAVEAKMKVLQEVLIQERDPSARSTSSPPGLPGW